MGEKSRIIGEYGEKTVDNFFKLIGWGEVPKNIELRCSHPKKHASKGSENRLTHGIDFFFAYRSPLVDGVLKSISVSVKYTSNPYPNAPSSVFKEHFEDLVFSIECFKHSPEKNNTTRKISGYSRVEEVGVLFWLSNNPETYDDLIIKLSNVNVTLDNCFNTLYIVDNKRIDFIYSAIRHAQRWLNNSELLFYYPDTGKNIIPTEKLNCGPILPVEYINTSILPIRLENKENNQIQLLLYTIDAFSNTDLQRLIGLTQTISKSWATRIVIAFPDYNELTHGGEARLIKSIFEDKLAMDSVTITSYNDNFKSLQ